MTGLFSSIKTLVHGEDTSLKFSVTPTSGTDTGFNQWLAGMKMVAQLPEGIPQEFRKTLWLTLAEKHLAARGVDWAQAHKICFNEWTNPDDEELGVQIVKDLHRTGCSLFCGASGQHNQALLRRVLLAYARWNKAVGYCQGFNMLGALILQVMDRSESDSVKVMIYLIEGVLPESYFANNLRGLSVDMAVFRDLLRLKLPVLSRHLEQLQCDSKDSGTSYEPPLTNVFTMQWFLTLFCNCLPQETVLRVWDLVFLEGNSVLLRTALAIWNILSDRILSVESADEFYSIMGVLTREMLEFGLMDTNNLVKAIVSINLPELNEMRERYMYNITPWTQSVSTVARRGLRLFYTDEDTDTDEDDEKIAIATAYALFRSPKRKTDASSSPNFGGSNIVSGQGSQQSPLRQVHTLQSERERVVMDISALKKQYSKLRERQRQAHIILTAACGGQSIVGPSSGPAMNHLLLGKSALVNNRGRRIGPPAGTIPPHPSTAAKQHKVTSREGETLHWKDTTAEGKKSKSLPQPSGNAEYSTTPDSTSPPTSSCSSRRSSSSSTSTELCDEPGRASDSDSLSDCYPVPDTSISSVRRRSSLRECIEEDDTPGHYAYKQEEEEIDVFKDDDKGSDVHKAIHVSSEPIDITNSGNNKEFPEQELDKVLFPFDRDYLTKYGSEDSSDLCISSCPASPCIYADEELRRDDNETSSLHRTSSSSHNIGGIYRKDNLIDVEDDEILRCEDNKIELISNSDKVEENVASSDKSLIQKNSNEKESSSTDPRSVTSTASSCLTTATNIRDSHSFHEMLSFSDNRVKNHDRDKRKSLQFNYKDRKADDQELELRKIWLEKCNEDKNKFDTTSIPKNVCSSFTKSNEFRSIDIVEENIHDTFEEEKETITDLESSKFYESNTEINSVNVDEIISDSFGIISDGNIYINTNVADNFVDSTIDIELKIDETQGVTVGDKKNNEQDTDLNKLQVLPTSSNQSSDLEDDSSSKEFLTMQQLSPARRGSEVQLNQILKENLEIIQKIQHTRRQKISASPNSTEEELAIDESKAHLDNTLERTTGEILNALDDNSEKESLENIKDNSNDYEEEKTADETVTNISFKEYSLELNKDSKIKTTKMTTKEKNYHSFTEDKSNSTISLTDISSADVSSTKYEGSTDLETSFESSFDNTKTDITLTTDRIQSTDKETYANQENVSHPSYKKKDYFSSTSSTSEEIDQKSNFIPKSFKDYKYDHTKCEINEKSPISDIDSNQTLSDDNKKFTDIMTGENNVEFSSKIKDIDIYGDDTRFKKYKGKSFHFETDISTRDNESKKLPRLKNYYSFDYSPKTKLSDSSFYDITKRRMSYSLDSGTDLPLPSSFNTSSSGDGTKSKSPTEFNEIDDSFCYQKTKVKPFLENEDFREKRYQFDGSKSFDSEKKYNFDVTGAGASYYTGTYSSKQFSKSQPLADYRPDDFARNEDYQHKSRKLFDENSDDFLSKYITRKEDLSFKFSSPSRLESTGYSMDSYLPSSPTSNKLQRSESLDTNGYLHSKSPRSIRRSLSPRYDLGKTLEECSEDFEKWKFERLSRESSPKSRDSPILRKHLDESNDCYDRWKADYSFSRDSSPKSRESTSTKSYSEVSEKYDIKWKSAKDLRESNPKLDFTKKFDDTLIDFDSSPGKFSRESSPKSRELFLGRTLDEISDEYGKPSREYSSRTRDLTTRKTYDENFDDFEKNKYSLGHSRESSPYLGKKFGESSTDYDKWKSSRESIQKPKDSVLGKTLDENSDEFEKWRCSKLGRETSSSTRDIYKRCENEGSPRRASPDVISRNISPKSQIENEKSNSCYRYTEESDFKNFETVKKKPFDESPHAFAKFQRSSTFQEGSSTQNYNKDKTADEIRLGDLEEINNSLIVLSKSKTLDYDLETSLKNSLDSDVTVNSKNLETYQRKLNIDKIHSQSEENKSPKRFTRSERRSTIHEYQYDRIFTPKSFEKKLRGNESMDSSYNEKDYLTKLKKDNEISLLDNEGYSQRQQEISNVINKNKDFDQSPSWRSSDSYTQSLETKDCDISPKRQQYSPASSKKHDELNLKIKPSPPKITSPNSPTRFNPFPSRTANRQPKEIGIKLGLYSPSKPSEKSSCDKTNISSSNSSNITRKTT